MCIFKKKVISPETIDPISPISTEKINSTELESLLKNYVPSAQVIMADNEKYLCHYDDIALFLAQDETNKLGYEVESLDCDDFAFRLKGQFSIPKWSGLALGICWTWAHALNFFITEDKTLNFIEPQTDEIIKEKDNIRLFII